MKLIKVRDTIDKAYVGAASIIAIMPIIGLLTGTAISMGYNGINYQEVTMTDDLDKYWFIINVEFIVVLCMALLSKLDFPLIEAAYQRILMFRNAHKVKAYIILYLIIPILAVTFIIFLLFLSDL